MHQKIYIMIRVGLGLIFIYSGAAKLQSPDSFAVIIDAFGLMPEILVYPVAVCLPLLEMVAGAGLLWDVKGSLAIISALLFLFISVLGYGILLGLDVDCGCFGPGDPEAEAFQNLRSALFRDMIMLMGVIYLYTWRFIRIRHRVRHQNI